METSDPYEKATRSGEQFISEKSITTLPIDPIKIASELGIQVQGKSPSTEGVSGMLLRYNDVFGIAFATNIKNEGFQRFSIGHELGHYLLPGHLEAVFNESGVHESFAGFRSENVFEKEADHFAAGLLMPNPMFAYALAKAEPGLDGIEDLASLCITSLTSTAIRYTRCADFEVAIVISVGQKIDYCFMSESFKTIKGIEWLKKRESLPRTSRTYSFNQYPERVRDADRDAGVSSVQAWFGGGPAWDLIEEVLGLGSYDKTLTVLRPIIPSDFDEEEEEFDKQLIESWTPRFRK